MKNISSIEVNKELLNKLHQIKYKSDDPSQENKFFWNMIGSASTSLMSVFLLLIVNQVVGNEMGGVFSFAYANAQLMMIIGGLEVRTLQSTDLKQEHKFSTYFTLRIITAIMMMVICSIYIWFADFSHEKGYIVFVFALYKAVEIFADVFAGVYQQKDRIDLCGKTVTLRVLVSAISFWIILIVTKKLFLASLLMTIFSALLIFVYDYPLLKKYEQIRVEHNLSNIIQLIKNVIPLFVSAFIMMYINNAPKYAIEKYCTDIEQNKYSILFMPAFVINLFSVFVFRPILVDMTIKWNAYDNNAVAAYIKKTLIFISIITVMCIMGGSLIGIPALSFLYNTDLNDSKFVFLCILLYGGFNALGNYCYYILTVMRKQKMIMIGYVCSFVVIYVLAPSMVKKIELLGAALSSLITFVFLDVILLVILYYTIKNHKK